MSDVPTATPEQAGRQHFRRQWHRLVIPGAFAVAAFGLFAYRIPGGVWIAIPALCVSLTFCAVLHGGLVLSREGIEWYVLHPKWRHRIIPWHAVLDVRKSLFGLTPGIQLIVEPGRYELWAWGTPRRDRPMDIVIHTRGLTNGEGVWAAIQHFWSSRDRAGAGAPSS